MDDVLAACDHLFLDKLYSAVFPASKTLPAAIQRLAQWGVHTSSSHPTASVFPRDSIIRQFVSLASIALISAFILYFSISSASYFFIFDRRLEHHPRYLPNQVRKEITLSVQAMPLMALVIAPWFVVEVRGGSRLCDGWLPDGKTSMFGLGPIPYTILTIIGFMLFTDYCIYWIHRWLHIPFIYKRLHKPHHRWLGERRWTGRNEIARSLIFLSSPSLASNKSQLHSQQWLSTPSMGMLNRCRISTFVS